MPSDQEEYLVQRLSRVARMRTRRMFGGVGIYSEELFFALIASDVLYFKVDAQNRGDFEARGMSAFQPFADKPATMSYYEVPSDVVGDDRRLGAWVAKALDAARAARGRAGAKPASEKRASEKLAGDKRAGRARREVQGARGKRARAVPDARTEPLARVLDLGPKARLRLAEVGVFTFADLERLGSVAVFRAVRARHASRSASLLYALEGLLLGLRWNELPDVVKRNLRERAGLP